MSIKQTELNAIIDISKTKKDGVYSKFGIMYAVKNNSLIGYWKAHYGLCQFCYGFSVGPQKVAQCSILGKSLKVKLK